MKPHTPNPISSNKESNSPKRSSRFRTSGMGESITNNTNNPRKSSFELNQEDIDTQIKNLFNEKKDLSSETEEKQESVRKRKKQSSVKMSNRGWGNEADRF